MEFRPVAKETKSDFAMRSRSLQRSGFLPRYEYIKELIHIIITLGNAYRTSLRLSLFYIRHFNRCYYRLESMCRGFYNKASQLLQTLYLLWPHHCGPTDFIFGFLFNQTRNATGTPQENKTNFYHQTNIHSTIRRPLDQWSPIPSNCIQH